MDLELLTNILNLFLDKTKMKKSNTKLFFEKTTVIELNHTDLMKINGGTTIVGGETCSGCCCHTILDKMLQGVVN